MLFAGAEGQFLESFLHNHHKSPPGPKCPRHHHQASGASPGSDLGEILLECEYYREIGVQFFCTVNGLFGNLLLSKGDCLHFLNFLQGKLPVFSRGEEYV